MNIPNNNGIQDYLYYKKMKKFFVLVATALFALSSFAVDKEKVAKANGKTISDVLVAALNLNNTPGATADMTNGKLIAYSFEQVGYELPTDIRALTQQGTLVKKQSKLQVGDLVFFNSDQCGIVSSIEGNNLFFLHIVDGKVMTSSSTGLTFTQGQHITSDKELASLRKEYESEQKAIAKAKADAEKAQKKADAEKAKAEKTKADAEKAAKKAQEKIDKANADAEKAAKKADKANQKRDDLINSAENK